MLVNILLVTFCVMLNSTATHETPEIYIQKSNPPLDFSVYPYQEDLISSIRYLKDEPKIKDEKVRGLINILKMILEKQLDDSNDEVINVSATLNTDIVGNTMKELNSSRQKKDSATLSTTINTLNAVQKPMTQQMLVNFESPIKNEATEHTHANVPSFRIQVGSNTPRPNPDPYVTEFNPEHTLSQNIKHNAENYNSRPVSNSVGNEEIYTSHAVKSLTQNGPTFSIPCHKASDILEETTRFVIPKEAYCEHTNKIPNMNFVHENIRPVSIYQEPAVTNSIVCTESEETVAMLFKPKTISLKQVYGNLLKKITVNVLVPYHVSKIAL